MVRGGLSDIQFDNNVEVILWVWFKNVILRSLPLGRRKLEVVEQVGCYGENFVGCQ